MDPTSPNSPYFDLASVLVRISRECDIPLEHLRAEQLVHEAQSAWPGPESGQWGNWLQESCKSLTLRARVSSLTANQAMELARDGGLLVGAYHADHGPMVLLAGDRGTVDFATGEIDERQPATASFIEKHLGEQNGEAGPHSWLVVEHPELYDADPARHLHDRPLERLLQIIRPSGRTSRRSWYSRLLPVCRAWRRPSRWSRLSTRYPSADCFNHWSFWRRCCLVAWRSRG